MAGQDDTVRSFYSAIAKGDTERAIALMEDRIEWFNVQPWDQPDKDELELLSSFIAQTLAECYSKGWSFQVKGRGSSEVAQHVIVPFLDEGASFAPSPIAFQAQGDKIVWLGTLTTIDGPTGERKDFAFAHVWTVKDCKVARLMQFTYLPTPARGPLR
jgi:ketosteroid isomerase-like protein